jgi:hypothetical protein
MPAVCFLRQFRWSVTVFCEKRKEKGTEKKEMPI